MDAVWLLSNEICRQKYISPRLDIDPRGSKSIEWHRAMIAAAAALRPQKLSFPRTALDDGKTQFNLVAELLQFPITVVMALLLR